MIDRLLKVTLSRGLLRFGVKNVLKFKFNVHRTHSILLERREKIINFFSFSKGRTNHSQFLAIFPRNKGKP